MCLCDGGWGGDVALGHVSGCIYKCAIMQYVYFYRNVDKVDVVFTL